MCVWAGARLCPGVGAKPTNSRSPRICNNRNLFERLLWVRLKEVARRRYPLRKWQPSLKGILSSAAALGWLKRERTLVKDPARRGAVKEYIWPLKGKVAAQYHSAQMIR